MRRFLVRLQGGQDLSLVYEMLNGIAIQISSIATSAGVTGGLGHIFLEFLKHKYV